MCARLLRRSGSRPTAASTALSRRSAPAARWPASPRACGRIGRIVFDLILEEGLCLGGSTGINIAGAMRLARELGPGHTIVTILCDYGTRYQSKLFNPTFLKEKGLPVPDWIERPVAIPVPYEDVA